MKSGKVGWMFAMAFIAILFNPVIPIYFKRNHWEIIDAIAAIFLLLSIPFLNHSRRIGHGPEDTNELDNQRYESLKAILWGVFWIVGACWFVYNLTGNPLDELALIQRGQTVKGYIVDIQESEQDDNGGIEYYYTYKYQAPNGHEFTQVTKHSPEGLQEELWNPERPYPIEVEYLSDDPMTSRIKGTGSQSTSDLLFRKVGGGSLFLAMVIGPALVLIRNETYELKRLRLEYEMGKLQIAREIERRESAESYTSMSSSSHTE